MTGTPVMRWRNSSGVICRFLAEWLMGVVRPEETLEDAPVRLSSPAGSRVRIRIAIMLEGTRYSQWFWQFFSWYAWKWRSELVFHSHFTQPAKYDILSKRKLKNNKIVIMPGCSHVGPDSHPVLATSVDLFTPILVKLNVLGWCVRSSLALIGWSWPLAGPWFVSGSLFTPLAATNCIQLVERERQKIDKVFIFFNN